MYLLPIKTQGQKSDTLKPVQYTTPDEINYHELCAGFIGECKKLLGKNNNKKHNLNENNFKVKYNTYSNNVYQFRTEPSFTFHDTLNPTEFCNEHMNESVHELFYTIENKPYRFILDIDSDSSTPLPIDNICERVRELTKKPLNKLQHKFNYYIYRCSSGKEKYHIYFNFACDMSMAKLLAITLNIPEIDTGIYHKNTSIRVPNSKKLNTNRIYPGPMLFVNDPLPCIEQSVCLQIEPIYNNHVSFKNIDNKFIDQLGEYTTEEKHNYIYI